MGSFTSARFPGKLDTRKEISVGIDYSFKLAVGWRVSKERLEKKFGTVVPAKTHKEDRYDPKTGKKVESEIVVDEPGGETLTAAAFGEPDVEYCDLWDLADGICSELGCQHWAVGSGMDDEADFIFGPCFDVDVGPRGYEEEDLGHITVDSGGVPLSTLTRLNQEKVVGLGVKLYELGLIDKKQPCKVQIAWFIS
jgi:hypothetical protein